MMESLLNEEDVVISGVSCRLPESDNVNEFRENLMNNRDMMTSDDRRWKPGKYGIPPRMAKIKDITKFDAAFFGVHLKQANRMDPQLRMLLETTYEAIVDAGVNPETLRGSNTGVFVGNCANDSQMGWSQSPTTTSGFTMIGCISAMLSNRLSFYFDFKGPSYTMDTACSASFVALDQALLAIRSGQCDAAIVAGANLCLLPTVSVQFTKLNMLSADGACKSFDESGNGYARAEAIVSIFLQKKNSSNRIYAHLVHSKINSDGAKDGKESITYPSGECQLKLMKELYGECGVNPHDVSYVEAHGTGTKAGDPEEVNAIADMFCEKRTTPLLLGSTKSNMGHPEGASGVAALTKVIIASEAKMLPANLHFKNANPSIKGLTDGRLKVVTENTEWDGGLVSISSFGFGGTNAHVVLDTSIVDTMVKEKESSTDKVRLVTYCGRTEASLQNMFEQIHRSHSKNAHFLALLNNTADQSNMQQPYRGFTLVNQPGSDVISDIQKCEEDQRELWYIFSGMGSQWFGMARDLMQLDIFSKSIERSNGFLSEFGIDLFKLLMGDDSSSSGTTINSFVSLAAIQVAIADVLNALGLVPDGLIGHSVGELGSGYADGSLTAQETILAAYWRGRCITDACLKPGAMAAVGLTWQEAKARCPEGVIPACHNSTDNVTISGDAEIVRNFVQQLKQEDVFAREVSTNGVAFHSPHMETVAPALKDRLLQVIKPKKRSTKWISTSVEDANTALLEFSSAEYHVNNLLRPVKFQEALTKIPNNAVAVEIAPHALLQSILKRSLSNDCINIGLQKRGHSDNLGLLYQGLGRIYQAGFNLDLNNLYNDVSFPVPRGTPSVSALIGWDHSLSYDVPTEHDLQDSGNIFLKYSINLAQEEQFLVGHKLDGRLVYPITGYFIPVWIALAHSQDLDYKDMPVVFEDVEIHAPTLLNKDDQTFLCVSILPSTGAFEVCHQGTIKASGKIRIPESDDHPRLQIPTPIENGNPQISSKDIYNELRLQGIEYTGQFQGIVSSSLGGHEAVLKWEGNWITFLDYILQAGLLSGANGAYRLPHRFRSLSIDPTMHVECLEPYGGNPSCVRLLRNEDLEICQAGGVQIIGVELSVAPRVVKQKPPQLETYEFIPYERVVDTEVPDYLQCCSNAARQAMKHQPDIKPSTVHPELLDQLVSLPNGTSNGSYEDPKAYPLLAALNQSTGSSTSKEYLDDKLLTSLHSVRYEKPAFDIVVESFRIRKLLLTEIVNAQASSAPQVRLAALDSAANLLVDYIAWIDSSHDQLQIDSDRITTYRSEHNVRNLPARDQHLVICSHLLEDSSKVEMAKAMLQANGFLLTAEYTLQNNKVQQMLSADFDLVYKVEDPLQTLTLWRAKGNILESRDEEMEISGLSTNWLEPLKKKLEAINSSGDEEKLWLVSNERNGTIGLANSLREETSDDVIRCMFNAGDGKLPDFNSKECEKQRNKNLVMNVYNNGTWGAYRHLPLTVKDKVETLYAGANIHPPGTELSNLQWIESPPSHTTADEFTQHCTISCVAINLNDMLMVGGKLQASNAVDSFILGQEFSGYMQNNKRRVMGLCNEGALATIVKADEEYLWNVPDEWSMREAATVPLVYSLAYYAIIIRGNLLPKEKVLINSATSAVGLAAMRIALSMGCQVIATVDDEKKKKLLQKMFFEVNPRNILDSRSTAFEFDIKMLTNGKGVNVVLNSLAEEKLISSINVLANHGRFLQTGRVAMDSNKSLGISCLLKDISIQGITIDSLLAPGNREWQKVRALVTAGIRSGVVKPLGYTLFGRYEIAEAFQLMASGKNLQRVIIEVNSSSGLQPVKALPRFYCNSEKSYLIAGGLGGVGLQVAKWLASKGAQKLVLTSRSGIKDGYQLKTVTDMRDKGIDVKISSKNVARYAETEELVKECIAMGPVGGVFNLAMVLRDARLENQTQESFQAVLDPKVEGTRNLDKVTRSLCSHSLDYFVAFSSIWGGRGNAGQTNYSYANTEIERICEERHAVGLPGLAIQWGSIGDVGVVIDTMGDNDFVLGGALPQRLTSCLSVLDTFLCDTTHPVLSTFVLADRKIKTENTNLTQDVFNILGYTDLSAVNKDSTLSSVGLDSFTATEIKQTLEMRFGLLFSMKEIKSLTKSTLLQHEQQLKSRQSR